MFGNDEKNYYGGIAMNKGWIGTREFLVASRNILDELDALNAKTQKLNDKGDIVTGTIKVGDYFMNTGNGNFHIGKNGQEWQLAVTPDAVVANRPWRNVNAALGDLYTRTDDLIAQTVRKDKKYEIVYDGWRCMDGLSFGQQCVGNKNQVVNFQQK
jgi:hypothetical protein